MAYRVRARGVVPFLLHTLVFNIIQIHSISHAVGWMLGGYTVPDTTFKTQMQGPKQPPTSTYAYFGATVRLRILRLTALGRHLLLVTNRTS